MVDWNTVSFVISGKLRFRILVELKDNESTPTDLSSVTNAPISHISKALKELEELNLITCLTPDRRKTKFYSITDTGKKVLEKINQLTK